MAVKRNPATDPQVGDVLSYKDAWTVRVVRREGYRVHYRCEFNGSITGPGSMQELTRWAAWAPQAKVVKRGDEQEPCTVTMLVSGAACTGCGARIEGPVHLASTGSIAINVFCEAHCPAKKHGKFKPKKKAAA